MQKSTPLTLTSKFAGEPFKFEAPCLPLKNTAGEVTVGDYIKIAVTVTADMKKAGINKIDQVTELKNDPVHGDLLIGTGNNGKANLQIKLEGKPELRELWENYEAINKARKAAVNAMHEAQRQQQSDIDAPLLKDMKEKAEALRGQIPEGMVPVAVTQTGDLDGWPIYSYTANGTEIPRADVTTIGAASALRPGALGSFAEVIVAYTSQDKIDAARNRLAERKVKSDEYKNELRTTPVPQSALDAYTQYQGNAEKAWESGDESSWAAINQWLPYIEAQHGMHSKEAVRQFNESSRESTIENGIDGQDDFDPRP